MDFTDFMRLLNALAASIGVLFLAVRLNDDWIRLTPGWRVTRLAIIGLVAVYGFGSVELMLVQPPVPLGIRVYLAFVCLVLLVVGLLIIFREDHNDGWIRASVVQGILDDIESHHLGPCDHPGCLAGRCEFRDVIRQARRTATG